MRSLFQSKFAIGCFLAAALVAWRFGWRQPAGAGVATGHGPSPSASTDRPPVRIPLLVPPALAVETALSDWKPASGSGSGSGSAPLGPREDPFAYGAIDAMAGGSMAAKEPPVPDLVLQAISIDGEKALAVVNRRVLACGERVGEWLVTRIDPEEVWVEGATGAYVLRFRSTPVVRETHALVAEDESSRTLHDPGRTIGR